MKWMMFLLTIHLIIASVYYSYASNSGEAVDVAYSCVTPETMRRNRPPILLLHGLTGSRSTWRGIYEVLAMQTKRMVCMSDARNHGASPRTEEFSYELLAADAVRLLDKLNISRAVVLGHSMGGKTGVVLALQYSNRVEKLIVEDIRPISVSIDVLHRLNVIAQTLSRSLEVVPEGASEEQAKEAVVKFIADAFKKSNKEMTEKMKNSVKSGLICNNSKCRFSDDMEFALRVISNPDLSKIQKGLYNGETMFIYGRDSDFKVGEAVEEIKELFPRSQLVGIEGAGHSVHAQKPQEFLSSVIQFINKKHWHKRHFNRSNVHWMGYGYGNCHSADFWND